MKQSVMLICILMPIAIAAILISTVRTDYRGPAPRTARPPARVIVPAGTYLSLRVVAGIFESSKPGETMQALSAEPVFAGSQLAIPENTRVAVHVDSVAMHNTDAEDVTIRVTQLIFSDETVPIESNPLVATMQPRSSFDLMVRSAGGLLGAAVGAAGGAAVNTDPVGAGTLEGLAAGTGSGPNGTSIFRFLIASPIDLTGIRW